MIYSKKFEFRYFKVFQTELNPKRFKFKASLKFMIRRDFNLKGSLFELTLKS